MDVLRRFFFHGNFVYKMHYVEFPWILPTKKFVEEVIMQIALIGCENSEACCETVTWLIEGAWWEGALGLRPQAWADSPLGNLPTQLRFVRKKTPNFKNWFIKIGYKDILAWVFLQFLRAFKINKCSIQIIHGNWKNTYADFVSEGSKNVYNRSRRRLLSSEWFLKFMFDLNSTKFKHHK